MNISGKGLCRAVKSALSSEYHLWTQEPALVIMTSDWIVRFDDMDDVPRAVLGLLVEHLGHIPHDECVTVGKGKEEPVVADMLEDVFWAQFGSFIGDAERLDIPVERIPLELGALSLWQSRELFRDGYPSVWGCKGSHHGLVDHEKNPVVVDRALRWDCDEGFIWSAAYRPEDGSAIAGKWKALESLLWLESGLPAAADCGGQTQIDDRDELAAEVGYLMERDVSGLCE